MSTKKETTEPMKIGIDSLNAQLLTKIMSIAQIMIKKIWNDLNDIKSITCVRKHCTQGNKYQYQKGNNCGK